MSANDSFLSAYDTDTLSENDSFCSITNTAITLGDTLRERFEQDLGRSFNVCHINAQSVPGHYSDLVATFTDSLVHAILISESFLKPNLLSAYYPLPGFVLIRNDRLGKEAGGVAIYLRSDLPFKIVGSSPSQYSASAEFLFLEVWVSGVKLVLGVVYCPPTVNYFTDFELVLESLGSDYEHHIIMGDLNTNLLAGDSSRAHKLLHIVESVSLHVLPLNATHHNKDVEDTWLDLILTSAPSLVHSHGQFSAPAFSHHDLIYVSYTLNPPKLKPKVLHRRCFGRMDHNKLCADAAEVDWTPLAEATTVDDKVLFFNKTVNSLYDIHAPVRRVKLKHPPAPWLTNEVRMAMRRRDRAYSKFKKNRLDINWDAYKTVRNRCNQVIRNAKRRHFFDNITSSSPADVWKFLGTLGIGKQRQQELPKTIELDAINRHFSTSLAIDGLTKRQTVDFIAGLASPSYTPFQFSPVTTDEIKKIILSIKSKAVGCDSISRRMITLILDHLLPAISHIINFSLDSGQFPTSWRKAFVRPLPKISNPSLPSHFRPISILPFLSKVLEACVHRQLSNFIHRNDILSPLQSGFRPGHSTTSALLKVTGDIRDGMEKSMVTVMVLVDFSNAFNCINHDILLSILAHIKISSDDLDWFSSYLQGRQQSVCTDEMSSSWCNLDSGVPQGGILSPLLFSIFINFLTSDLQCAYHLYADDLQLYSQAPVDNISEAIDKVNADLGFLRGWCDRFGLAVNPDKCQSIIIGSSHMMRRLQDVTLPLIKFDGKIIPVTDSVKNLGLNLDSTLSWRVQVTNVCQRVTGTLRALYRLKNFLPHKTKTMLMQSLIFPIFDYGDVCYFDLNADLLNKLDRLLNNCIRFVYNLRKYDHVSACRAELGWLPIRRRRSLRAVTLVYTLLNSPNAPTYLKSHLHLLGSNHNKNLRSSNNLLLHCPTHTSSLVHSSFSVQSILLWNALPLEVRMSPNRTIFKNRVRQLYNEP